MSEILNSSIGFNINVVANAIRSSFAQFLKPYSIAPEQFATLSILKSNPNITQTQIAQIMYRDKTTVTRMIESLIKKELIVKEQLRSDRRVYNIKLSEKGERLTKELEGIVTPVIKAQREQFSKEELTLFFDILNRMKKFKY